MKDSTTLKDRQRLAVIPNDPDTPMTAKVCQRLAVIPNNLDTPMTAKDRQGHSATTNDYMETRLKSSKGIIPTGT